MSVTRPKLNLRRPSQPVSTLTYVDLFCGIGSFHYSFAQLGWRCVMACDLNPHSCLTYATNYGQTPMGDIVDIDPLTIPAYDILCAGFPCQPFSNIGQHKGFNDDRGLMFNQIMKFVKVHHPKVIVLENVSALLTHDQGRTFARIVNEINAENYVVKHAILRCDDYGLPQMRKRLFIMAIRQDVANHNYNLDQLFDFQGQKHSVTLSQYLGQNFARTTAYTLRCGGRRSPLDDKHNWDGYLVNNREYRLTLDDAKKLQGFPPSFQLCGSDTDQWKQLGNTIPTIFTKLMKLNL